jgi:hypothetical protein
MSPDDPAGSGRPAPRPVAWSFPVNDRPDGSLSLGRPGASAAVHGGPSTDIAAGALFVAGWRALEWPGS